MMAAMNNTLKQWLTLVLILLIQIQPVQVHAQALGTEQSGHIAGQLAHSHGSASQLYSDVEETGHHQTECHPSHTLFSAEQDAHLTVRMQHIINQHHQPDLTSVDLGLDLPPPRSNSI